VSLITLRRLLAAVMAIAAMRLADWLVGYPIRMPLDEGGD